MIRLLFLSALLAFSALPAAAQDESALSKTGPDMEHLGSPTTRDSVYYTMDDGIMSKEEMEEEATYIFNMCNLNSARRDLFDCQCLAGAYLKKRETLGPMVPQADILYDLTLGNPADCANTEAVAGESFKSCMEVMAPHRNYESKEDNIAYCECTANKVAREFGKRPAMAPAYIRVLTYEAYLYCNSPAHRTVKKPEQASAQPPAPAADSKTAN